MENRLTRLLGIRYPIIQAGMIWCSGWKLAAAVSNAGGLGLIGSGSMYPEVLQAQIEKCQKHTERPFGVNVPMLYPQIEDHLHIIAEAGVQVVFTSAGNPKKYTAWLQERDIKVVHVVSSLKFALKAQEAGVDAVVAEGFEAGGHNGRDETTSMVLLPQVAAALDIPVIGAGGFATGRHLTAALALGAEAIQVGSRFVATEESSAHPHFKDRVVGAREGDTILTLKELAPVRMMKNGFYDAVKTAYAHNASPEELKELLGRARAKKGMFEGDMEQGELEIGQVSSMIGTIKPAAAVVEEIWVEHHRTCRNLSCSQTVGNSSK